MHEPRDPANLVDHCRALSRTRAQEVAYTWLHRGETEEISLTFAQLDAQARKIAVALSARGLRGERALLLYSPGLEFITAFLGCLYAGVAAVPLVSPRNERAAETMLGVARHAKPSICLTDTILMHSELGKRQLFGDLEMLATDELAVEAGQAWRPDSPDPTDLAFVQYTSGSTGSPRGVEVTHGNLIRNEEMIREGMGHGPSTIFVGWLPLFHDMGLVGNVLQPLFLGVRSVLMSPSSFVQKPVRWLRAISHYRGTTSGGPNFGYDLCVKRIRPEQLAGLDLSSWNVAYNGAEPVRPRTLERFTETFAPAGFRPTAFYPCYGLAEAALYVTGGLPSEPYAVFDVDGEALASNRVRPATTNGTARKRIVGCGRAWLDQRILIVDPSTAVPAADDAVGEIWLQGGNVARGYRDLPAGADDPFRAFLASGEGPFFRTGDLGFLRDGELYVTGRLKDVVIKAGRNYYPQDLELTAGNSHPYFRTDFTAAFTVDDDEEERLVIVQEVHERHCAALERDDERADELRKELVGAVRSAIANHYAIHAWRVVLIAHGGIPKTSSGKIQRRKCRGMWTQNELPELIPPVTLPVTS